VAERVVGSELDHDRQLSLVDSYLDELSASGASGAAGASGNGGAAS
jgi:hypothetical protein